MDLEVTNARGRGKGRGMTIFRMVDEFTADLGGRFYSDGDFSGEEFRVEYLFDLFDEALKHNQILTIDFDGVSGMPTSFLEEAFGGLVRARPDVSAADMDSTLRLQAPNSPKLWPYVQFAQDAIAKALNKRSR